PDHPPARLSLPLPPRPPRAPRFPYTTLFRSTAALRQLYGDTIDVGEQVHAEDGLEDDLELHDDLDLAQAADWPSRARHPVDDDRSEEHTSELQSPDHLVCRLLLEKK